MICKRTAASCIVLCTVMAACTTVQPTGVLNSAAGAPDSATALIRPAQDSERQYKPNAFVRVLMASRVSKAGLVQFWSANSPASVEMIFPKASVRVSPGTYVVKVSCSVSNWLVTSDVPVEAKAGKAYILECAGATAHNLHVTVREIEAAR